MTPNASRRARRTPGLPPAAAALAATLTAAALAPGARPAGAQAPRAPAAPAAQSARVARLTRDALRDRIRGGWVGQTVGVTFGGPTEFRFLGAWIPDEQPIRWDARLLAETYRDHPGLYDDLYVDLTFADVVERLGVDAPARAYAEALADAPFPLWHANQAARYNVRHGVAAPASGHWRHNPEADAIDFQIESDFIGLMHPGLPQSAAVLADTVGHVMNAGDGWYGGVFVATMYALAFTATDPAAPVTAADVRRVVTGALAAIPAESKFHQTVADAVRLHDQYPQDWHLAWAALQRRHAHDVGTPRAVFDPFNIDARLNAAYVVFGLLYGGADFTRTLSVATRAGQDSDCNPSTAAGVLGTMLGYARIPAFWKQGLDAVEGVPFKFTTRSLRDAYAMSERQALAAVRRAGGTVTDAAVAIPVQPVRAVRLEQNFPGLHPTERRPLYRTLGGAPAGAPGGTPGRDTLSVAFTGTGFALHGEARSLDKADHVVRVRVAVDGGPAEVVELPTNFHDRRFNPVWRYGLADGPHTVRLTVERPTPGAEVWLEHAVVYGPAPVRPRF